MTGRQLLVDLMILVGLFLWGIVVYIAILYSGSSSPSCQDRCSPYVSAKIDDACHCATENGYKRLDGLRDDAERTSQ